MLNKTCWYILGHSWDISVRSLQKRLSIADIRQMLHNKDLLTSFAELANMCILFMTLPVSVATADRSFSKLKIIKTYLKSTIAQERLDSLVTLSIENEEAQSLDTNKLIDMFGELKSRAKNLQFRSICLIDCFN